MALKIKDSNGNLKTVTNLYKANSDGTGVEEISGLHIVVGSSIQSVYQKSGPVSHQELCFESSTGTGIIFATYSSPSTTPTIEYAIDDGSWTSYTIGDTISCSAGSKVYVRGNNSSGFNTSSYSYVYVKLTGAFKVSGNIMSLVDTTCTSTTIPCSSCFCYLFKNCTTLYDASDLILPATTLTTSCYQAMFRGCTGLTAAPTLPAMTMQYECYGYMFYGCTSLTTAPALPSTSLSTYCYCDMFEGCTGLTSAPALPAMAVYEGSYDCMFYDCTGLTTAPSLPATSLGIGAYRDMFRGCSNLVTGPSILPATYLFQYCYQRMFYGCSSLTTPPSISATDMSMAPYCCNGMFKECTSLVYFPYLHCTAPADSSYNSMFEECTSLGVYSSSSTSYSHAVRIPTSGTMSGSYTTQPYMFYHCAGDYYSSKSVALGTGITIYTQNEPV